MKSFVKKWTAKIRFIGLVALGVIGVPLVGYSYDFIQPSQIPVNINTLISPYSLTLPFTFQNDSKANADQINADFQYLLKAFNDNFLFETPKTVSVVGHIKTVLPGGGQPPTLAPDCAAVAKITGTDSAGIIKFSGLLSSSCVVTFSTPFASPPACTVSSDRSGLPLAVFASEKTFSVWSSSGLSKNPDVTYICLGL